MRSLTVIGDIQRVAAQGRIACTAVDRENETERLSAWEHRNEQQAVLLIGKKK